MRRQLVKCSRCYRRRYADRMNARPGRVADEPAIYVCAAKSSCKVARKAYRRWLKSAVTAVHDPAPDLLPSTHE